MTTVTEYVGSAGSDYYTGSGPGTKTWSNAADIEGTSAFASATSTSGAAATQSLDGYNAFSPGGANIPTGSTIDGLSASIVAKGGSGTTAEFGTTADGHEVTVGGAQGKFASYPTGDLSTASGSGTTYNYGGSSDLADISSADWTPANANSATEGTGPTLSIWFNMTTGTTTVDVQGMQLTITYTAGGGAPTTFPAASIPVPF